MISLFPIYDTIIPSFTCIRLHFDYNTFYIFCTSKSPVCKVNPLHTGQKNKRLKTNRFIQISYDECLPSDDNSPEGSDELDSESSSTSNIITLKITIVSTY